MLHCSDGMQNIGDYLYNMVSSVTSCTVKKAERILIGTLLRRRPTGLRGRDSIQAPSAYISCDA